MEAKTRVCVYKTMGAKGFWQPPEEAGRDAWDRGTNPENTLILDFWSPMRK